MPDVVALQRWAAAQDELQAAVASVTGELSYQLARVSFGSHHVPMPVGVVVTSAGNHRVAVFVDGPGTRLSNAPHVRVAPVAARDEMLRMAGWRVLSLGGGEWPPGDPEAQRVLLGQRLTAADCG